MIVVLDTNVLVSALLSSKGKAAEIVRRWESGAFEAASSPTLIQELARALGYERVRKYTRLTSLELETFIRYLHVAMTVVSPEVSLDVIQKDFADNRVLECALESGAAYIVTGDEHLLELKEYRGIVILTPASFLTLLDLE
jgi:hypothetical protein